MRHRVAAELVAHRGDRLHRRALVLLGDEPREEGRGDRGHGDAVVDAGLDGPATFARVGGVAGDLVEVGVLLERLDQQVEQPRPDDGALTPRVEDLGDVVDEVDLLEQLPALGVRLHDGVLDAVVNHLGEVAGARLLAGVHEAGVTLGLERVEGGLHLGDVGVGAAAHQGVAVLQAPDPAGDTAVDEPDALRGQEVGVDLVVGPLGVAAVDDQVTLAEELGELLDGVAGRVARRDHHPDDLRARQLPDHLGQARGVGDVRVAVVADHRVPGVAQAAPHVATHLAETDESEFHEAFSLGGVVRRAGASASGDSGSRCRRHLRRGPSGHCLPSNH